MTLQNRRTIIALGVIFLVFACICMVMLSVKESYTGRDTVKSLEQKYWEKKQTLEVIKTGKFIENRDQKIFYLYTELSAIARVHNALVQKFPEKHGNYTVRVYLNDPLFFAIRNLYFINKHIAEIHKQYPLTRKYYKLTEEDLQWKHQSKPLPWQTIRDTNRLPYL